MPITPNSDIYLLYVPIDSTQKNQIYFLSRTAQETYMNAQIKHTYSDYSYQRKDNIIRIDEHIDNLWDVNYVMYRNNAFGTRYFYAFITRMEYINDNRTDLYIETDVYQTWMLDCSLKDSFVVREHIKKADDAIGASMADEGLDTGEYIKMAVDTTSGMDALAVIVAVTEYYAGGAWNAIIGGMYAGVYSGLAYYAFFGSGLAGQVNAFISTYQGGHEAAIVTIFMIPADALPSGTVSGAQVPYDNLSGVSINKAVSYSTTQVGSYTPRNKKVLQYPYHFLHVTNLAGQSADFRFELTYDKSGTFNFSYRTNLAPGAKTLLIPKSGYKRTSSAADVNSEEGLTVQNYPMCAWLSDAWSNWIAQNAITVGVGLAGGTAALIAGAATGSAMAAFGGAASIAQQLSQMYKHAIEPDHAQGNLNGSTVNIAWGMQHFQFCEMAVTDEYARRLDEYFDMFGYKTNRVKIPNVSWRSNWNYVQTIDMNIHGDIPSDDMSKLKDIYNKGVTLWKNTSYIGDYSQTNNDG